MKKEYLKPAMQVYQLQPMRPILMDSGDNLFDVDWPDGYGEGGHEEGR